MFLHNLNIHLPLLALDEGLLIAPKGIYVKVPQPKQSDSLHLALKSSNPHELPESILQLPVKTYLQFGVIWRVNHKGLPDRLL